MNETVHYPDGFPQVNELPEGYAVVLREQRANASYWWMEFQGQPIGSYLYPTPERARWAWYRQQEVQAARELIERAAPGAQGRGYTREEYECACAAVGIAAAPDSELGHYGDHYGDFWMDQYSAVDIITAELRRCRMRGLPPPPPAAPCPRAEPLGQCDHCGADAYPANAMNASLGLACGVECYDALSG